MQGDGEPEKRIRRDPSQRVVFGLCLVISLCIYLLRDQLPRGESVWWGWIMVGVGILLVVESLIREFNMKNRWSTYVRLILAALLAEAGAGFIYGFEEIRHIFIFTCIQAILLAILFRRRFVRA